MEPDDRDRYPCRSFETGELHIEHHYDLESGLCERCGFKDATCTGTRRVHPYDDAYTETEPCFYEAEWMGIPARGGQPQPYCDDCINLRTRIYPPDRSTPSMNYITIHHIDDTTIALNAPYYRDANADYRQIGGKWNSNELVWKFDARDLDRLREVLTKHFGHDDRPYDKVDVRVTLDCTIDETDYWRFGRLIAKRRHRDDRVTIGAGVIVTQGAFPSRGGSMKYPAVGWLQDMEIEVRDVPANHPDIDDDEVTVISKPDLPEATLPHWREPVINEQGTATMPPIEETFNSDNEVAEHSQSPTGRIELTESSTPYPSIWMSTVSYGEDIEFGDVVERTEQANVDLRLPAWQARRLAYQLLDLAERADPHGGTEPEPSEA